jgi:hypothetical protein
MGHGVFSLPKMSNQSGFFCSSQVAEKAAVKPIPQAFFMITDCP